MPTFSVRVPADCAERFDLTAASVGGRSALLRRLIAEAGEGPSTASPVIQAASSARLMVRLSPDEAAFVEEEARAMGLSRTAWVTGLVRRRARLGVRFSRSGELALIAIHGELRRIGVNVNQIARACSARGLMLEGELSAIADLGLEVRRHMIGLRRAFDGDLSYWEGDA